MTWPIMARVEAVYVNERVRAYVRTACKDASNADPGGEAGALGRANLDFTRHESGHLCIRVASQ